MANDLPQWAFERALHTTDSPFPDDIDRIARAFVEIADEAEARGAERMKERAAEVAESFDKRTDILKISGWGVSMAIRNLEANNG